jgi:signal transduction histidine kinase/ActR/RegA family two-component response regulator
MTPTTESKREARPSRALTIRSHLLLLAMAAFLPVLAFGVVASLLLVEHDRETQRNGALDRTRAMMTAVDAELRGTIAALRAITAFRSLDRDDLPSFYEAARRALATQPAWLDISLATPSGKTLVDASVPWGAMPPPDDDPGGIVRVAQTLQPLVGDVTTEKSVGLPIIPIRVPVVRQGRAVYVLTAMVRPDAFEELIQKQHLPPGWASGVADSAMHFVARVPAVPVGTPTSEGFRAAAGRAREGWYRGLTVEGTDTFTAHLTSASSGWSVGLALPTSLVESAARRSGGFMALGALLSIALALGLTLIIARRIAGPIGSVAAAARSLGRGGELPVENAHRVREMSEVAAALGEASRVVREREELLEREKAALKAADAAKNEFLAMLSHELRNPLAAMSSAANLLTVTDPHGAPAGQARVVIERQTKHMRRLIEDLLDVSRITMGKASLTRIPLDLAETVERVVETWRADGRLGTRRLELAALPVWVDGDAERLEQIVSNLLDNAIKFSPPSAKVTVTLKQEGDAAVLVVSDDGEGIAPDLIGRVFDLFVQGERGIDRGKGGMGIGLALVKMLAGMHGGTAAAASAGPGQGATFTVRLPAVAAVRTRAHAEISRPPPRLRRILIIEDNDDAREMLREWLVMNGHDVQDARDGASGLALAERLSPDVALIDIGLPDMDGYEVARRLRSARDGTISLIALTGYGQPDDRRRALEAGFDVHLTKPVETERLDEIIAALGKKRRPAAS